MQHCNAERDQKNDEEDAGIIALAGNVHRDRNGTDLFSRRGALDGVHGIMAYNRTDQEKGRATIFLPPSERIVSVGRHPGLIPGKVWVSVQESLERNKSKSFRKPRNNEALLTGLLFCRSGARMYPKMSQRKTADGKPFYTYVCKMKERSQRPVCNSKNANGNTLDLAIIEQMKAPQNDSGTFVKQLEQSKKFYTGNRVEYEKRLGELRKSRAGTGKKSILLWILWQRWATTPQKHP